MHYRCIHELFEGVVAESPDAIALVQGDQELSYAELDLRATRFAAYLRARGVGPEVRVALCLDRSCDLIVALLGVLKAGGTYVPLDPGLPEARLQFMLRDSGARTLVADARAAEELGAADIEWVCSELVHSSGEPERGGAPPRSLGPVSPENIAYVTYTSGSTGEPKGAEIPHRSIPGFLPSVDGSSPGGQQVFFQHSSISWDAFGLELWPALLRGGRTVLCGERIPTPRDIGEAVGRDGVGTLWLTSTLFNAVIDESPDALGPLDHLLTGGEALSVPHVRRALELLPRTRITNGYGPSECTVFATVFPLPRELPQELGSIPIGRPVGDRRVYLLNGQMRRVPVGASGELYIGGPAVARGYLNRPELTALTFVPDAFGAEPGARLYKTGDSARWLKTGQIEFLGRIDRQVKLRGYRIELGEIEAVLRESPQIREAAVQLREDTPGAKRLVGYVVPEQGYEESTPLDGAAEMERVSEWRTLYEDTYGRSSPNGGESAADSFNITGWNSSYTGEPIPAEEMNEWVEATVDAIRSLGAQRILEIGCGTGLLLLRLAPHCRAYCGTDFSREALRFVQERVSAASLDQVTLREATADDFTGIAPGAFDAVVLNSIVQYFPSLSYFSKVLEGAVRAVGPKGSVFIGDVRNLRLLEAFHASVQLYQAPASLPSHEVASRVRHHLAHDKELVLDPSFFTDLPKQLPTVSRVSMRLKRGRHVNELTQFRYDVVLHVDESGLAEEASPTWLDWRADGLTSAGLRERLSGERPSVLGVRGIPNARVAGAALASELLREEASDDAGSLRRRVEEASQGGVDPVALWALGDALDFRVDLCWSAEDSSRLDALFRLPATPPARFTLERSPVGERPDPKRYANDPLRAASREKLVPQLRRYLGAKLPDFMVPSTFVVLDRLPRTTTGKLDRKRLPAPAGVRPELEGVYVAPRTDTEEELSRLWAEILRVDRVGVHDNFFDLGGHSLMATQVISRIRESYGVELPLRELFGGPTVAAMAKAIEHSGARTEAPPIEKAPRDAPLPLSFAQQRLWLLEQLVPDHPFYNAPVAVRMSGALDVQAFSRALSEIGRRHESLRTTFAMRGAEPVQVISERPPLALRYVDLTDLPAAERERHSTRLLAEESERPFDLESGPVARALLVRCGEEEHVFLLALHHIVSDGWSLGVLVRELVTLYQAYAQGQGSPLPELPVQYADFAAWQRKWFRGEVLERQLGYWREKLVELPTLALPTDRPRPATQSFRGAVQRVRLSRELHGKLVELSQREGVTFFMILLAGFQSLLSRYTGQRDIVVGSGIANRNRKEVESIIGFFVNMLVMRTDLSGEPTFREVVQRVKEVCLGAYAHQDLPFEKLVEELQPERDLSREPLFQVAILLQNAPMPELEAGSEMRISPVELPRRTSKYDMTLSLWESGEGVQGDLEYSTELFDGRTIERLWRHYEKFLEEVATDPMSRISEVSYLTEDEREELRGLSIERAGYGNQGRLEGWFEASSARHPDAVAVVSEEAECSYLELNRRANQLAHHLRKKGVGPERLVGLCVERTTQLLVGILGILKAGGAYLPLDPRYPSDRLRFMLEDAASTLVVSEGGLFDEMGFAGEVVDLDRDGERIGEESEENPRSEGGADNAAYVIYTSGSTGRPKGVVVSHANVARLLKSTEELFGFDGSDVWSLFHSYAFDFSVWELWGALLYGGRLVVVPYWVSRSSEELFELLKRERVTVLNQTPSSFRELSSTEERRGERLDALRYAIFGGEALEVGSLGGWFARHGDERPALVNMYGITETTVHVTFRRLKEEDVGKGRSVIGVALPDLSVHLLDESQSAVALGVPGELYVGGAGLARGYLGRPELTAERFVPRAEGGRVGERLYKSGDRARWLAEGELQYFGRLDHQVKIRGFRIELGEIENRLSAHPEVDGAAVAVHEDESKSPRLVGYVVVHPDRGASESLLPELRSYLSESLPEYMVPSVLVPLPSLPLNANGKVDRKALPAPDDGRPELEGAYVAPRSEVERAIARSWSEVLGVQRIGVHDDFFELGGQSLLATQVVSAIRSLFQVELPLRQLFETPTVAGIASLVSPSGSERVAPPIERAPREERIALSFAQQRLWFLDQLVPENAFYNMPIVVPLSGALEVSVLRASLNALVSRHESLRTVFPVVEGLPEQRVLPSLEVALPVVDLGSLAPEVAERRARELATAEANRPFDLSRGPLVRASVVRLSEDEHQVLLTMHHIVGDGWSIGIVVREMAELYEALSEGREPALPELAIQYADFAAWQREWFSGEVLESQLEYWREQLAEVPALQLPLDRPRPSVQTFRGGTRSFELSGALSDGLRELGSSEGATLFMVLLAGFQAVLSRYSGQDDIVVGAGIANRNRSEIEGLIGFFVNMLVMRTKLVGEPSFRELVRRVKEVCLGAYMHQDLPFEKLVEELHPERDLAREPLFQVAMVLQNAPMPSRHLPSGLTVRPFKIDGRTSKYDVTLYVWEESEKIAGFFEYNSDLFDEETIERMVRHFERLLTSSVSSPERAVSELPILSEGERLQIVRDWNETQASYPSARRVVEEVEAVAGRAPSSIALASASGWLSYGELNRRANALAERLRELSVSPEKRVVVCMERCLELGVAMLGVLKAGGAYVPLDPGLPSERLAFFVADCGASAVLVREGEEAAWAGERPVVALGGASDVPLAADVGVGGDSAHLAYLIYTSGSTGRPKGVAVEHRSLMNLVSWHQRAYEITEGCRASLVASPAFDASVWELWPYLCAGASVHIPDRDTVASPVALAEWLGAEGMTHAFVPTPLAEPLLAEAWEGAVSLRALLTGGDRLQSRPRPELPFELVNHYGPTENTVVATACAVAPEGEGAPSIGRPIQNVRGYVVDGKLEPLPVGSYGELYLGGRSLARGYLGRPERTAERFVPDPFGGEPGERLYRTGDRVRYLSDGNLDFQGRVDHQVKLRGYRIELGEIEAALRAQAGVKDAAVMLREEETGNGRLVAYVVGAPEGDDAWNREAEASQIGQWQELYEDTYRGSEDAGDFNIVGWKSSYTGEDIGEEEMREWREATVSRLAALEPKRVLEIGCGTGLLLLRLAEGRERYVGMDFSRAALDYVQGQVSRRGLEQVTLLERRADELEGLESESFDLVILNSVVQYFPSIDYLVEVLEKAVSVVVPGGSIFVGDVRNHELLREFHTEVALHQASASLSVSQLRSRIDQDVLLEKELLIAPSFFHALGRKLPGLGRVEVEVKRGRHANELTRFRYDVTLRVGERRGEKDVTWLDWERDGLDVEVLSARLRERSDEAVAVRGVPDARVLEARSASECLERGEVETAGEVLELASELSRGRGVDPEAMWSLGESESRSVQVLLSTVKAGSFDVVFEGAGGTSLVKLPGSEEVARAWASYGNDPLRVASRQKMVPELRRHLLERLPEYMVPSSYVLLDSLPLTPSGKVDRRSLPSPSGERPELGAGYVAPRTEVEEKLAELWGEVLGLDQVGARDNFFELGGHSLLATQVISRIRESFGVELALRELFGSPTVEGLAKSIELSAERTEAPPIEKAPRDAPLPLSFAQERLWFFDQLMPGHPFYNVPVALRVRGTLSVPVLHEALEVVAGRHESFRTLFVEREGTPVQVISPEARIGLPVIDLEALGNGEAAAHELANEEAVRPFDLERGPLVRATVLRLASEHHVLLLNLHHIIADGWSMGVFVREMAAVYASLVEGRVPELAELPIQYADFTLWQRQWLQGEVLERHLGYWKRQLSGAPTLSLPTDHPRPSRQSYRGASYSFELPESLTEGLIRLGRDEGCSLYMTLLAAFQSLLSRYTHQVDIVVGSGIANRNRGEIERLIGFFVNMLVMRTDLSANPGFREVLARVRETALGAFAHQDLPFELLVEELRPQRDLGREPLFQVAFFLQNFPVPAVRLSEDATASAFEIANRVSKFDLTLFMWEEDGQLGGMVEYATDLFEAESIQRMMAHFRALLEGVVSNPGTRLLELPLMSEEERRELVSDWSTDTDSKEIVL